MVCSTSTARVLLARRQQLHLEDQGRAGRDDAPGAPVAVAQRGRNDELPLPTHLHGAHALVPALDDLATPDGELERLAAIHRGGQLLAALAAGGVVAHARACP